MDLKDKRSLEKSFAFLKEHKYKSKIFVIFIFIVFLLSKLSLFNYLGFISISDAKSIIRDFEKSYLYDSVFNNSQYMEIKSKLLKNRFTTKSKIHDLIIQVKKLAGDNYTELKYVDFLQGKFNYSLNKKMHFNKKNLGDNTIYVKISSFGQNAALKFNKKNTDYLVLDLRGNYTGNYYEAIQIADDLLPEGLAIVQIEYSNSKHFYNSDSIYYDFNKIYVLVDKNSGYCSEIVALALKENLKDKVVLIGNGTMGIEIGSIYKSYNNKIGISIASLRWNINGKGIKELNKYIIDNKHIKLENIKDNICLIEIIKLIE